MLPNRMMAWRIHGGGRGNAPPGGSAATAELGVAQGIPLDRAALEMGLPTTTLEMWVRRSEQPLLVPVQIADERELGDEQRLVVELGHGVRVHGLTLSDVAELARRLS